MELFLSTRHVIPTFKHSNGVSNEFPVTPFQHKRLFRAQIHPCRFFVSSKKSSFRDFQEFSKPKRLLPTKELVQGPPDKIISSPGNSLYKVRLSTSSIYGSDLSNQNAGILVCIIDENGDSLLERIPAILSQDRQQSEDAVTSDVIRFQRSSTDECIFGGPKLERIQGSWRISGASLTTFSADNYQRDEASKNGSMYCTVTYNFETEDVLLGEGGDLAMTELRPCLVTEHFGTDSVSIIDGSAEAMSNAEKRITKEDSMREYADLKNSLLLYDSMLIFTGTCITSINAGNNTALAFLTGGVGGFLYLLLLQRSVDTLPAPESSVTNKGSNFNRLFEGGKAPIVIFLFAFAVVVLATSLDKPDVIEALTPRDILAGMGTSMGTSYLTSMGTSYDRRPHTRFALILGIVPILCLIYVPYPFLF